MIIYRHNNYVALHLKLSTLSCGFKAQQIHKYETVENRLSAEAVQKCCEIFGVPVNYFYGNDAAFNVSDLDKTLMLVVSELTDLDPRVRADILKLVKTLKTII